MAGGFTRSLMKAWAAEPLWFTFALVLTVFNTGMMIALGFMDSDVLLRQGASYAISVVVLSLAIWLKAEEHRDA